MTSCMISLQYLRVLYISCNGGRNVLLNNYIIDKLVDTINGLICIRIAGGHPFL